MTKQKEKLEKVSLTSGIAGCVWYRRDQWDLLQQKAVDPQELGSSYDEWVSQAEQSIADMVKLGLTPKKIDIDVVEMIRWCASKNRPLDGAARAKFAQEKLRKVEP